MKRCVCYDNRNYKEKRIVVKTHSFFNQGKVWSNAYCLKCGKQTYIDENALCIDIEEFNVPLDAIVQEFKIVNNILNSRIMFPDVLLVFNIIKAIIWAYEVDYYEKFDNYVFGDVRNGIIDYFTKNSSILTDSFLENEENYTSYLDHVKKYLTEKECKNFNLESALSNPIIFTSTNHEHFGPASLVYNEYTDTLGHSRKSNNFYYPNDKYYRLNKSKLEQEAIQIHTSILNTFKQYVIRKCKTLPLNFYSEVKSFKALKDFVLANYHGKNQVFFIGFWIVFSNILENGDKYINLSSRTYSEYLSKLKEFNIFVDKLIKEDN